MLLIECSKIKKYYGDRLILDIDHLKIHSEDRIGIVGGNGVGKTTLLNILCQRTEPDEGWVKQYAKPGYISQLELPERKRISDEMVSKFCINSIWEETMSGGKKEDKNKVMVLSNRLTEIIGRLSMPQKGDNKEGLEREYYTILEEIKRYQN